MSVLIIAEHNNQKINPVTYHAISAAAKLGKVDLLVAGHNIQQLAETAKTISDIAKVIYADEVYYSDGLAEELAPLVVSLAEKYSYIGAAATTFGKNLMPRVAALLDVPQISDLTEIIDGKTFVRPIYAGNAFEMVESISKKTVLTFRMTAFQAVSETGGNAEIESIKATPQQNLSRFVKKELTHSDRPKLGQAEVIVSGGRALGSAEKFEALLGPLADALGGAAIGATRAAVDAGYAPNDTQVGQTGKVVAPQLYIAVGISGAIQHTAGMQDSKVVVAINKDPDAAIFNIADYGLVGDLFDIVPRLTEALKK